MKKIILSLGLIALALGATAQVKIKDGSVSSSTTPNSNAILELESNSKGLLYPRVALVSTDNFSPLSQHIKGMVVYDTAFSPAGTPAATAITPGIYYNDGTQWVRATGSSDWLIFGNANNAVNGTPAGNTDSQYVMGRVAIGTNTAATVASATSGSTVAQQTAMLTVANGDANINGVTVGAGNSAGIPSTPIGTNTIVGLRALYNNNGSGNTAIGTTVLGNNTNGSGNTGIGALTLGNNTTGSYNTALGNNAGNNLTTGNNNIAIGAGGDGGTFNPPVNFPNPAGNYQLNIGNVIYGTSVDSMPPPGISAGNIGINVVPTSTLQVGGSFSTPAKTIPDIRTLGNSYTLTNEYTVVVTGTGMTVTLPAASVIANAGRMYRIVNMTASALTISTAVIRLSDGTSVTSIPPYSAWLVQCVSTSSTPTTTTAAWYQVGN